MLDNRDKWLKMMIELGEIKGKYGATNNEMCLATTLLTDATKEWLKQEYIKRHIEKQSSKRGKKKC